MNSFLQGSSAAIIINILSYYCTFRCRKDTESGLQMKNLVLFLNSTRNCIQLWFNWLINTQKYPHNEFVKFDFSKHLWLRQVGWQFYWNILYWWIYHLVIDVATACFFFGFVSTIWKIWIFYVYKHKKRRLFLVLWLRIWFIVWFKSIFTPAATLWIFEKFLSEWRV